MWFFFIIYLVFQSCGGGDKFLGVGGLDFGCFVNFYYYFGFIIKMVEGILKNNIIYYYIFKVCMYFLNVRYSKQF